MSYYYDEEAIYQDADIEMFELEQEANRLHALEQQDICTHQGVVGLGSDGKAHYPEAEGLIGEQVRCTAGCGRIFENDEEWIEALGSL